VGHSELRPVAAGLYARVHDWFVAEIRAGIENGGFARCGPDEVADRALVLLDGYGVRTMIGQATIALERTRRAVTAQPARDLGLGERLAER
jgi:hypothetical protein